MTLRQVIMAVGLFAALAAARVAPGEIVSPRSREAQPQPQVSRFQRVYVPEGEFDTWPEGPWRYVPVERSRFEQFAAGTTSEEPPGPRVAKAEYEATFENDTLSGTGLWSIETPGGEGVIDLFDVSIAIAEVRHGAGDSDDEGMLCSGEGGPYLTVKEPGTVSFAWSAKGNTLPDGSIVFDLRVPESLLGRLRLSLPPGYRVAAGTGIRLQEADDAEKSQWRIELGGRRNCRVRLIPPGTTRGATEISGGTVSYAISAKGIDLSADWDIRFLSDAVRSLEIVTDPTLRLARVELDRQPCEWTPLSSEADGNLIRVEVPEAVREREGPAVLYVEGVSPGASGTLEVLPRIWVAAAASPSETVRVRVDSPLTATRITPAGAVQTGWSALPAPARGELFEFLCVSSQWRIEYETALPRPSVSVDEAVSLQFGPGEVQARAKALFQATQGRVFAVEADVADPWIVDSVQSDSPGVIEDWSVERARRGEDRRLTVQLAKPLTPKRPLEMTVFARRLYSPREHPFGVNEIRPLRYPEADEFRRMMSLHATGDILLRTTGDETLTRIDPEQLENERFGSFLRSSGTLLFFDDKKAELLQIAIRKRVPRFSTRIECAAGFSDGMLTEDYTIECVPDSTRIERLWVRFSQSREEPPRWAFADGRESRLQARKLDAAEKAAGGATLEGETWEIVLAAPRSVPFEICASRRTPADGDTAVGLAWLPEAEKGEAFVSVLANAGRTPTVVSSSLEPAVPDAVPPDRYLDARAVFAYGPRDLDAGGLVIRADPSDANERPIWAWKAEIDSEFASSGKEMHAVRYYLENTGVQQVRVRLPGGIAAAQVRGVRINGAETLWDTSQADGRLALTIPVPHLKKHLSLTIVFTSTGYPLGLVRRLETPRVDPEFPVLQTDRVVRLAPGYAPVGSPGVEPGIVQRLGSLFGPFAPRGVTGEPAPMPSAMDDAVSDKSSPPSTIFRFAASRAAESPSAREGWSAYRFPKASEGDGSFLVVQRSKMESLGYAALLAVIGLGVGVFRTANAFWFRGAAACVVAALLISPAFLSVVSGVFLGFVAVVATRLLRNSAALSDFETGPTEFGSRRAVRLVGTAIVWLAVFPSPACTAAQVTEVAAPAAENEESSVFPVLIPVGGDPQKPASRALVPEPLYRQMHLHEPSAAGAPPVAILSAAYDCELVWSVDELELVPREWRFRYEIKNAAQSADLALPVKSTEGVVRSDGVRVDGRLTAWRTVAGGMLIPISEPGRHRVEVWVRPKVLTSEGTHGAAVGIPKLLSAEATLTVPVNGPRVDFVGPVGKVVRDRRTGKTRAMLGPVSSLALAWTSSEPRNNTESTGAEAKCLLWMHLRPDSVRVDTRLSIHGLPEDAQSIDLAADARLRLAEAGPGGGFLWMPRPSAGSGTAAFRISAESPFPRPLLLSGSFVLGDSRGTDRITVPRIAPDGIPVTRSWLAVSVDPRLKLDKNGSNGTIPVEEFVSAWGEVTARPDFACVLDGRERRTLEASLKDDSLPVKQETVCEFDADSAAVRFRAEIDAQAPRFLHRVDIPPDVEIENSSVYQEDVERSVRWSRDSTGAVTIFLSEAVFGKHVLTLRGRMQVSPGEVDFPLIRVRGAEVRENRLLLARRSGASVRVLREIGCAPLASPPGNAGDLLAGGRLVGAYRADSDSPRLTLAVERNVPVVEVEQITAAYIQDDAWHALVELRLVPREGVVDRIELGVSNNVAAVERVVPAEPYSLEQSPGTGRLILRPNEAIRRPWRVRLELRLEGGETAMGVLPKVELVPSEVGRTELVKKTVVLPARHGDRDLDWQRRHLRPVAFPADFAWPGVPADAAKAFEVVSDDYDAVLLLRDVPRGIAAVRFADVYLDRDAGRIQGVAVYDVEPAGHSECPLDLPPGCELIRAFVSGVPVCPTPRPLPESLLGGQRYSLPLASRTRSQRVSLVFQTESPKGDRPEAAAGVYPRPAYLQVQDGIVTVRDDAGDGPREMTRLSAEQADLLRLRHLADLIRREGATIAAPTESDLRWYSLWSRRLVAVARRLDPVTSEAKTLLDEIHGIARRWKKEDLWNEICIESESLCEPRDVWESVTAAEMNPASATMRFRLQEHVGNPLAASAGERPFHSPAIRYLAAAVLAVAAVYLGFACRGRRMMNWFFYPHFAGVVLGLAWYAALRPGWLGLVVVGVFAVASVRPAWRWVRVWESSSVGTPK